MLALTFLNVGNGLSVVVEYIKLEAKHYAVIDSNIPSGNAAKTLTYLQSRGVTDLSFVALTHPHADHFTGLFEITQKFRIREFYSFSLGSFLENEVRFNKYQKQLAAIIKRTTDKSLKREQFELMQILKWARDSAVSRQIEWRECDGEENAVAPPGFDGVRVATIAPPKASKGDWITKMDQGDADGADRLDPNEISLAFQFEYAGKTIVIGGDATNNSWKARKNFDQKRKYKLRSDAVCLPHHGSNKDNSEEIIDFLVGSQGHAVAISSADGKRHPHDEVIRRLIDRDIMPYCTNLIERCGANVFDLVPFPNLDRELARWLMETSVDTKRMQVCQGDVRVEISDKGQMTVTNETGVPCPYRGDWQGLFP